MSYNGISLFSGIGGFELGLEVAGLSQFIRVIQFIECNRHCQRVLTKHWPDIPIWDDIKTYDPQSLDGRYIILFGGFPCQPFSYSGKRRGASDERHLWPEVIRLVRRIRPRFVVLENVDGLRSIDSGRVFGTILADLAACGMRVEWSCVSAAEVGAVHRRERVFLIAYAADTQGTRWPASGSEITQKGADFASFSCCDAFGYSHSLGLSNSQDTDKRWALAELRGAESTSANSPRLEGTRVRGTVAHTVKNGTQAESSFCGSNDGFPTELDRTGRGDYLMRCSTLPAWLPQATNTDNIRHRRERLEALGNSVCPNQVALVWHRVAALAQLLEAREQERV